MASTNPHKPDHPNNVFWFQALEANGLSLGRPATVEDAVALLMEYLKSGRSSVPPGQALRDEAERS